MPAPNGRGNEQGNGQGKGPPRSVPNGRATNPIRCSRCGTAHGHVADFDDGETFVCGRCDIRFRVRLPTPEQITKQREIAQQRFENPGAGVVPAQKDGLVPIKVVPVNGVTPTNGN